MYFDSFPQLSNALYQLACYTILYYDYFLTLRDEVEFFWMKDFGPRFNFFFVNRYLNLLGNIPTVIMLTIMADSAACLQFRTYRQVFLVFSHGSSGIYFTFRTYALYGGSRKILCAIVIPAVLVLGVGIGVIASDSTAPLATGMMIPACEFPETEKGALLLEMLWGAIFLYETFLFALLSYKEMKTWRKERGDIFDIFFRDGVIYFIVLFIVYISTILILAIGDPSFKTAGVSLCNAMSTVLISRFMINLRKATLDQYVIWPGSSMKF